MNILRPPPPHRWIQWGAFSPMFRTHCTKSPDVDRRIWVYPAVSEPASVATISFHEGMRVYVCAGEL